MSKIKICQTCHFPKIIDCFKREPRCKDGITPHCKDCLNEKKKKHRKDNHTHYLQLEQIRRNRPYVKEYIKKWRKEHLESLCQKSHNRYKNNPIPYLKRAKEQRARDPEGYKAYLRKWNKENLKWSRDYYHNVRKKDINWRIRNTLRGSLRHALDGSRKTCSVLKYLGCSMDFFKGYLEAKFVNGMAWDNYGTLWHIDHIIPCKAFDMTKEDDRKRCFYYSNLQPLLATDNCSKQDKMPDGTFARNLLTTSSSVL